MKYTVTEVRNMSVVNYVVTEVKNMVVAVTTLQMTSLWGRTSEARTERNKRFAEGFNYH